MPTTAGKIDRCIRCRKAKGCSKALWMCRFCGKQSCRHYCKNKDEIGRATCGACSMRLARPFSQ